MITKCPRCNSKFKVRDDWKGKETKCPKCKQSFTIGEFIVKPVPSTGETNGAKKKVEVCAKCGRIIGKLEKSYPFKGIVVCAECDRKLRSASTCASEQTGATVKDARNTIKFKCSKCGTTVQSQRKMVGYPDVCPKCMSATLVTDEVLGAELERQGVRYKFLREVLGCLYVFGVLPFFVLLIYSKINEGGLPSKLRPWMWVCCVLVFIAIIVRGILTRMGRKWVLELGANEEKKRNEICKTVVELRASGQNVRLCDMCRGTGNFKNGWLDIYKKCRKCTGKGFLSY